MPKKKMTVKMKNSASLKPKKPKMKDAIKKPKKLGIMHRMKGMFGGSE